MRPRKVFLVNLWPILKSLTLRIGPKNHVILNPASISSYQPELDQHHILDSLASYSFLEIELEIESDSEPQVGNSISLFVSIMTLISLPDFFSIPESTLNLVSIHREIESPISYNHTSLMEKVCEHQFFGLDPVLNQFQLPFLNLNLICVKFSSRYWFLLLFHLSPNQPSSKITLHCWTRMLTKMTQ